MSTPKLNASARIMFEEAKQRGIQCHIFDDHETLLMRTPYGLWYTRGSRTSLQSSVGRTIANEKPLTKQVLNLFGLPTAKYLEVRSETDLDALHIFRFPVVMKPLNSSHGRGVVVGIEDLETARASYRTTKDTVMFEEMLAGTEYRIVCVNFKFVAAAFRKPAFVTGDGRQTIEELIAEKNQHPWRGEGHETNLTLIKVDEQVQRTLSDQGHNLQSIPSSSQEVKLRKTANLSTGGESWDVTDQVSDENRRLFEAIAKVCDLNIIGIDMMCDSLTKRIIDQPRAGVIEVNASPGLRMHHFPMQGKSRNVAGAILDMMVEAYQR